MTSLTHKQDPRIPVGYAVEVCQDETSYTSAYWGVDAGEYTDPHAYAGETIEAAIAACVAHRDRVVASHRAVDRGSR